MTLRRREIYSSPNGDRWLLVRDMDSGRVFVTHEPNLPSGGQTSSIEVGAFLARGGHGPEHQELLNLIGTLVDQAPAVEPAAAYVEVQRQFMNVGRELQAVAEAMETVVSQLRFDVRTRPAAVDASRWPNRDELQDLLDRWHAAHQAMQQAWDELPEDLRAGLQPPPHY